MSKYNCASFLVHTKNDYLNDLGYEAGFANGYVDENGCLFTCPAFSVVKYGNSYTFEVPQARVRVEYVHQLQHAIRLAEIDKEIEL